VASRLDAGLRWLPKNPALSLAKYRAKPASIRFGPEGTGNCRGLDPGRTPEASRGIHIGISPASLERTTPSISPWITSERRSVSPSGVSPENVSRDS